MTSKLAQLPKKNLAVLENSPVLERFGPDSASDPGRVTIIKTQNVDAILRTIHELPEHMSRRKVAKSGQRLIGTVPNVIALKWAQESGLRLYSKEWMAYARKKLDDPEWAKLKVSY